MNRTNLTSARIMAGTFALAAQSGRKMRMDSDDLQQAAELLHSLIDEVEALRARSKPAAGELPALPAGHHWAVVSDDL